MKHQAWMLFVILLLGCSKEHLKTQFVTETCVKPLHNYTYLTCDKIVFTINDEEFYIPKHFKTDLASIPKFAWPVIAPFHSSLIRPAIVHDWFYRKTCDFDRQQTDIIFYHMLLNEGVSTSAALFMYYTVRVFGYRYYNEDYCE